MSYFYLHTALIGWSSSHSWSRWLMFDGLTRWWVLGKVSFTKSGWAVVDDFGVLVEVPL